MEAVHHFAVRYPDITTFPDEFEKKISIHGLHLKSQKQIQVGERVGLQFRFPQREDPLVAVGIIAWVSTQADTTGKRGLVVKNIDFDASALEILALVQQTPEVQVAPGSTAAMPPVPPPPTAPIDSPPPAAVEPAPAAVFSAPLDEEKEDQPEEKDNRKMIAAICGAVLILGLLIWLFALGGTRFIAIRFLSPPPAVNVGYSEISTPGVEPPIPGGQKPPVKKAAAPVVAIGFDYYQKPAVNEFIITFNRPIPRVVTSRIDSPLMQTFYIEKARINLEKEQFFLPFDLVRTVSFEVDGGVLHIRFIAQQKDYLPQPVYDIRGRELSIRFIASD